MFSIHELPRIRSAGSIGQRNVQTKLPCTQTYEKDDDGEIEIAKEEEFPQVLFSVHKNVTKKENCPKKRRIGGGAARSGIEM